MILTRLSSSRSIKPEMMSDASEMLAAALEQMDGIIAGNHSVHTLRAGGSTSLSGHGVGVEWSHIWRALTCELGVLCAMDVQTMRPSPPAPTCSLIRSL